MLAVKSSLQLLLQLVQEAPVAALGDELLRAGLDHPGFVEAQGVEANSVFRIELAPSPVRDFPQRLTSILVLRLRRVSLVDEGPGDALRLLGAKLGRLEDGPDSPLGRDRMLPHEFSAANHHTTEVLRPWSVHGAIHHHVADLPGAKLLSEGWEPQVCIDRSLGEALDRVDGRRGDPTNILARVQPDVREHTGHEDVLGLAQAEDRDGLAL